MLCRSGQRLKVILQHVSMSQFSSQAEEVLFESSNDKRLIILNRPKALNALNLNMIRQIYRKLMDWENDPSVSLVLIKAHGERAFCAGGDIRAVTEAGKIGGDLAKDFFREEYIVNYKIGTYKKPYIAIIDGITMGGGVGLSVHGNFRVATERTVFAMPETAIGLFPDVGGGHFLPSLKGKLGIYLALTGFRLKGRDVFSAGIATHFVQLDKLSLLEKNLMSLSDATEKSIKCLLDSFHDKNPVDKDKPFTLEKYRSQIDRIFKAETVEEMLSNLKEDGSEWAQEQLKTLQKMSPTSMKVTLRQLQQGKKLSLAEVLKMEYRLSQRCIEDHDFYEGVRALLVDKDQTPKWKPLTLEGVTKEKVDWYFSPLSKERELQL